ncbi:MAG: hypothetical protein WBE97_05190 [Candidatus Acidiferrales bacterium]
MRILRHTSTIWICTAAMLAGGAVASAQMPGMMGGGAAGQFKGIFNPVIGSGAVYQMTTAGKPPQSIGISVVGKEDVDGAPGYWLEIASQDPRSGGTVYIKMLVAVNGGSTHQTKMIMQMAGRPPMEIDMPAGGMMPGGRQAPPQSADISKSAQDMGSETVTVPAGTFTCEHYRGTDGDDVWITSKVSPWGLVKMNSKNGTAMELEKVVTDAKDMITGTPTVMQMPNMGGLGAPSQH